MQFPRTVILLRILSITICLGTLSVWIAGGAHRGWTQTSITEFQHDVVTGIEYPVQRPGFVPGVEILATGLLIGAAFFATSWVVARRPRVARS